MNTKMARAVVFFINKPFRLFFAVAAVTLVLGVVGLHASYATRGYIKTTGEICNVKQKRVLQRQGYVTRFSYDLRWQADGEVFEKHFSDMFDPEPEGEATIWVSPDKRDAQPERSGGISLGIDFEYLCLCISLVSGLLAVVMYRLHVKNRRESPAEREERLEDNKTGSIIAFILSLFGVGYCVFDICKSYRAGKMISSASIDLVFFSMVAAVICLVIFFMSRKQLNTK